MTNNHIPCCIIITTTDQESIADKIALSLVKESLSKCVQKDHIQSIYEWKGEIINSIEYRLMAKCSEAKTDAVMKHIKDNHNYEVPEILKIDIAGGNKEYIRWMTT